MNKRTPQQKFYDRIAKDEYRNRARQEFAGDDLQIDFDAQVRLSDNGAWVQAWVYVYNEEE